MFDPMRWIARLNPLPRYLLLAALVIPFAAFVLYSGARSSKSETTWHPEAKYWKVSPLLVYPQDFPAATTAAVSLWNKAADCEIFRVAVERAPADIVVKATGGTPCGVANAPGMLPDHAGGAYIKGDCAEVHVAYPGDLRQQLVVVAHELGHLLGFGDDASGCRIMRGSVEAVVDCSILLVSDRDSAALRKRYCKGGGR